MDNKEIKETFLFSNEEIKKLKSKFSEDIDKINSGIYKNMIRYRDDLREVYYRSTLNYKILKIVLCYQLTFIV